MAKGSRLGSRRGFAVAKLLGGLKLPLLVLGGLAALPNDALAQNAPPNANPDTGTARSGPVAGEQIIINAAANDSDPDGDPLNYNGPFGASGGSGPAPLGTVIVGPSGTIRYTPPPDFSGDDVFSYTVDDGLNPPVFADVVVTVVPDIPPVAADDTATTAYSNVPALATVQIPVLQNDSDADDNVLAYADIDIVSGPQNGSVTQSCVGACNPPEYTPNRGFIGTDTFTYQVADPLGALSNVATVTITVTNNPPTAVDDVATTDANVPVIIDVLANDLNPAIAPLTLAPQPLSQQGGTVVLQSGDVVEYTPPGSFSGQDTFTYTIFDDVGNQSTATVTVTVVGGNEFAPVVTIRVGSTQIPDSDGQPGEPVPFEGSAVDSDGTVSVDTFRWYVNDELIADADGQANPTLPLANGSNSIVLTAMDDRENVGSDSIVVVVGEAGALAGLPGIEGNENLENTAGATDATCSALLKADPSTLTSEQLHLRSTCETIYANVEENPDGVVEALQQISSQQVTAQQSTAIDFTAAQLLNVAGRLTALRQGASGLSVAGLNVSGSGSPIPVQALASMGRALFGEGGASGDDDEGGLLDDRLGIFVNGSVRFGDKEATDRESGFDFDTLGVTIGADYRFTDALVAGLAVGYGNASADFDAGAGSQDSDSYSGSLYGSWYGQRSYFDAILSIGSVSYDTVRKINLFDGAIVDEALGSTDGTQWAAGVATGWDFGKGGLRFGPNLAVNYIKVDIDGFHEKTTGTSGLAMAFEDQDADSLTAKLGGHLSYSMSRKWGVFSPQARFDVVREFANDSQKVTIRYANDPVLTGPGGAGNSFVIFTDDPDEYYFLWAVGFAAQFVNGLAGFVDYEQTEGLETISTGEISFGVRYQTKFR